MTALFITFEGLDGSGKSTHLRAAFRWLEDNDIDCQVAQEPGGTPLGDAIRETFLDPRWGEIALATQQVVDACAQSAKEGRPVALGARGPGA